jgi:hypothetical protein
LFEAENQAEPSGAKLSIGDILAHVDLRSCGRRKENRLNRRSSWVNMPQVPVFQDLEL